MEDVEGACGGRLAAPSQQLRSAGGLGGEEFDADVTVSLLLRHADHRVVLEHCTHACMHSLQAVTEFQARVTVLDSEQLDSPEHR